MTRSSLTILSVLLISACSPAEAPSESSDASATQSEDQKAATVTLTRLDCGSLSVDDLSVFSTAGNYKGVEKTLTDSCYLIRHGEDVMLWDTGLPGGLAGNGPQTDGAFTMELDKTIVDQLAENDLEPSDIDIVGVSHFHDDHTGQLSMFPDAKLLTGKQDWDAIMAAGPDSQINVTPYEHWKNGGGVAEGVTGDYDVFGDGSVVMLALPGHTPGHTALKVELADMGTVMLSGDVTHFNENYANDGIPTWNSDKDESLVSIQRFKDPANETGATVIIQHEPEHVEILPAFPAAAE